MVRSICAAAAIFGILAAPVQATAQALAPNANAEALGQCMALKSTGADRLLVARWLLANMATAPQVSEVVTLQPGLKVTVDKGMAALFTRLLTVDCADQSRVLFKAKDNAGFRVAGEALGRVAMSELLSNRQASSALEDYTKYLDEKDFAGVTK